MMPRLVSSIVVSACVSNASTPASEKRPRLAAPRPCFVIERRQQRAQWRRRLAGFRAPAGEQEGELELRAAREEHVRRHRLELGRDAVARQELRHRLRDRRVVDVAVVRRVQRQAEAVRIAGLRQQLLGCRRIVFVGLQRLAGAEELLGQELARRAPPCPSMMRDDDRVAIDHLADGLAHARDRATGSPPAACRRLVVTNGEFFSRFESRCR